MRLVAEVIRDGETWSILGSIDLRSRSFLEHIPSMENASALSDNLIAGAAAYDAKNWREAFTFLQPVAAAGCGTAATMIGTIYHLGLGVDPSTSEARRWYEIAAARGEALAAWNLGVMLESAGDPESAAWKERALEAGFDLIPLLK